MFAVGMQQKIRGQNNLGNDSHGKLMVRLALPSIATPVPISKPLALGRKLASEKGVLFDVTISASVLVAASAYLVIRACPTALPRLRRTF